MGALAVLVFLIFLPKRTRCREALIAASYLGEHCQALEDSLPLQVGHFLNLFAVFHGLCSSLSEASSPLMNPVIRIYNAAKSKH